MKMRKKLYGVLTLMLSILCILGLVAPSFAIEPGVSDIKGHWAQDVIKTWLDQGRISGYPEGTFRPDQSVTRAEFMSMVNQAFGFEKEIDVQYSDVRQTDWFAAAVKKAVSAGYISGYPDGTMKPERSISRQEAAVILTRSLSLIQNASRANLFKDWAEIPRWSKGSVGAVLKAEVMSGYPDDSFRPDHNMTRAEAVTALDKAMAGYWVISQAGTYGPSTGTAIYQNVVVKSDEVNLQNLSISGNLTIAENLGNGVVTLNQLTVEGDAIIQGDSKDRVQMNGGTYANIVYAETAELSYTTPPFAFSVQGSYHEALYQTQTTLRDQGQLFGILIDNAADWKSARTLYKFESARTGQTLDYEDDYFRAYALLLVFGDQGSSSVQYQFGKSESTDSLIDVTLEKYVPEIGTTDMVMKGFVAGLEKTNLYLSDGAKKPLNITQRIIQIPSDTARDDLATYDLKLGNLSVYLTPLELDFRMSQPPLYVEKRFEGYEERRIYEDVEILIVENEVFMISTTSSNYATPRGIRVGDTAAALKAQYGEPSLVKTLDNGNEIYSFDIAGLYHLFHAEIKGEVIVRLQVNLTM
jgi:hypothetical protein